jgi:non-ribosomal peptide synthase protein (TIGR01720 family)
VLIARTPAALAALARPLAAAPGAPDDGNGTVPLAPIVHWWLEQAEVRDEFTMSMLFRTPAGLDLERVAHALRALTERHGALRLRLSQDNERAWRLEVCPTAPAPELSRIAATGLSEAELRAAAETAAGAVRLAPEDGRMLAAAWFDADPEQPGQLLLTVHHLAVDAVSWWILGSELTELLDTGGLSGPPPATSLRGFTERLHREAGRAEDQLAFWQGMLSDPAAKLAADRTVRGPHTRLSVTLSAELTEAVLTRLPAAFRCGPDDVMLTALLAAGTRWRGQGDGLLVDLEGHGRETPWPELDLSGTVGWLTSQYPVRLDAGTAGADGFWRGGAEPATALKQVKEQLRAVPTGGLGYGQLRRILPGTVPLLAELPTPDLRFNYLGRLGDRTGGGVLLGMTARRALPRAHLVELDATVEPHPEGARLNATWSYPADSFAAEEIGALAESWRAALAVLAEQAPHGGATASDFPLVELDQAQIHAMESELDGLDLGEDW